MCINRLLVCFTSILSSYACVLVCYYCVYWFAPAVSIGFICFGFEIHISKPIWWRFGSGGKSCRLAVGGLPVRSHPGRVEVSQSKTPNPRLLLTSWLVAVHGSQSPLVCECVCEWMRSINCTALWIKALYKCNPFSVCIGVINLVMSCFVIFRYKVHKDFLRPQSVPRFYSKRIRMGRYRGHRGCTERL